MAVRSTMANLITRVRLLINDPSGTSQTFADQDIQDVLDASRIDVLSGATTPRPTFVTGTIQYLDYFTDLGDREDDLVLKQFLTIVVTPSLSEPIPGHFQFAASTLPPVFITGKTYDVYRAAADLLERWAAKVVLAYNVNVDGQSLQRSQMAVALQTLAETYRRQSRAHSHVIMRSDVESPHRKLQTGLGPLTIDYMSGGRGH